MFEPNILIIDDVPENISVLFESLITQGYEISIAADGESALDLVEHEAFDLILLDVMMPGIDGFETCRRLKENPRTADIPVIFMTALSDTLDKVKGFRYGAVDYITKPLQLDETLARVKTHITIRRLQQQLKERNEELAAFAHTVAHDLKNPLSVVLSTVSLLEFAHEEFSERAWQNIDLMKRTSLRMGNIIDGLLTFASTSHAEVEFQPLDTAAILSQALERIQVLPRVETLTLQRPEHWPTAFGNPLWVEEIWTNLLSNGVKYGGTPPLLEVGADMHGEWVRFWVRDNGQGLSTAQQAALFVPFTRLHMAQTKGYGLGLSIVQRIATRLGGEVGVESAPGAGSTFFFTLPASMPLATGEAHHPITAPPAASAATSVEHG